MATMNHLNNIEAAKMIIVDYFPDKIYHITFHRQDKSRLEKSAKMVITIYNKALPPDNKLFSPHGFYCIRCEIFDYNPSILHIHALSRCGLRGTDHLERLIAFSKACGLSRIDLEDKSTIMYDTKEDATYSKHFINLQQLLRLMTGKSWYEKFGFTNEATKRCKSAIDDYINKPIGMVVPELLPRIQHYVSITETTLILEAVHSLYKYLQDLCPNRICQSDDELGIVDDINDIIGILYKEMLVSVDAKKMDFYEFSLLLQTNQQGSSRKIRNKKVNKTHRRKRTRRTKMRK
jgi:hypothetical protein